MTSVPCPYSKIQPEFINTKSIQRMPMKDSALVELLRVESPSSLFVRPISHIRDQLVYTEPYFLVPHTNFEAGNYALAPIEERVFGRCLIVRNIPLLEACRVFFIDDAVTANVSWKCLFVLKDEERFHPWQAMHISLGRLGSLTNEWSFDQRRQFLDILSEFPKFEITPCQVDIEDDQEEIDRPSLLVNLYGIEEDKTMDEKVSIEEICGVLMPNVMVTCFPTLLTEDPRLAELDKEQDNLEVILLEEFRRQLPYDWRHEDKPEYKEGDEDWDIVTCKLVEWDKKWLKKYLLEDGCFWGFITTNVTVSPWDMHITPILKENEGSADEQWIFDQFDTIKRMQLVFDDFYVCPKNQRPLDEEEIRYALTQGRAYAIAAVEHRKKTGPQWLRVEILDILPNNNLDIRFVDQGFRGFENIKNIYRIHRLHTEIPPFQIPMGLYFDDVSISETEMGWSSHFWRDIVPFDVPIVVGPKLEFIETGKLQFAEIREIGEQENLLDEIPPMSLYSGDGFSHYDDEEENSDLGSSGSSEVNYEEDEMELKSDRRGIPEEEDEYDSEDPDYYDDYD
ncbi:hypothetical protein L5515_012701 [Caenorhabditis briggsae]|uniref:Tudor domain-containing protein n=1 Tax=Caenorhabditis briggsae TaxID=6238 RepID=A0AAE9EYY6_CAEBR|nr:hypothetical protein L5515_012701 [Caenorhabditis briggsae]